MRRPKSRIETKQEEEKKNPERNISPRKLLMNR